MNPADRRVGHVESRLSLDDRQVARPAGIFLGQPLPAGTTCVDRRTAISLEKTTCWHHKDVRWMLAVKPAPMGFPRPHVVVNNARLRPHPRGVPNCSVFKDQGPEGPSQTPSNERPRRLGPTSSRNPQTAGSVDSDESAQVRDGFIAGWDGRVYRSPPACQDSVLILSTCRLQPSPSAAGRSKRPSAPSETASTATPILAGSSVRSRETAFASVAPVVRTSSTKTTVRPRSPQSIHRLRPSIHRRHRR